MIKLPSTLPVLSFILLLLLVSACGSQSADAPPENSDSASANANANNGETGTLSLTANGEDFVRQGFITKDGWRVDFDHVFITLADFTAYQTDPPYNATTGVMPDGESVVIAGPLTVDLAAGDENAEPIVVEAVGAAAGQYNALGWRMVPASADGANGDAAGATISLTGVAVKDGLSVNFVLNDATEYAYNCGEFVGDNRKGILDGDGAADMEATFHFDHLFGDADTPADDALNVGALGFDPLAALAEDGALTISVAELEGLLETSAFTKLVDALAGLGHVGEGHCYEAVGGYTGHSE